MHMRQLITHSVEVVHGAGGEEGGDVGDADGVEQLFPLLPLKGDCPVTIS